MLSSVEANSTVIIADLEAGIGTLMRLPEGVLDVAVIVVEPTAKSLDVGKRASSLVCERRVQRVIVVGNRIQNDEDVASIGKVFAEFDPVFVPFDSAIMQADREGFAPLDISPESPAVLVLKDFAGQIQSFIK